MICLIRNRSKFYKQMLMDIWGQHVIYKKISKLLHYRKVMKEQWRAKARYYRRGLIYSLAKKINFRRRKKLKKNYIRPKLLYNFYIILRRRLYRKYLYKAKRKAGFFFDNYLLLVEGRLFMLIYRSNFITNIFKLKFLIDKGIFFVNGYRKFYSNYNVKIGELIQVDFKLRKLMLLDLKMRFEDEMILRNFEYYLFINYKFMFIFFIRSPKKNEICVYPINLDPYIGADLYYL